MRGQLPGVQTKPTNFTPNQIISRRTTHPLNPNYFLILHSTPLLLLNCLLAYLLIPLSHSCCSLCLCCFRSLPSLVSPAYPYPARVAPASISPAPRPHPFLRILQPCQLPCRILIASTRDTFFQSTAPLVPWFRDVCTSEPVACCRMRKADKTPTSIEQVVADQVLGLTA